MDSPHISPHISPRITPTLDTGTPVGMQPAFHLRMHDHWTDDLTRAYGGGVLQGPIARRAALGLEAFLAPMRAVWPRAWEILMAHSLSFRFLEQFSGAGAAEDRFGLWPLIQLPNTFVSFASWPDGHIPSPFTPEEDLADFGHRVGRLPAFLAGLYRDFCEISLNDASPYPSVPDLSMLTSMPYGASRVLSFQGRRKTPAALKAFHDPDALKVINNRAGHCNFFEFLLFFDDSEAGDGRVFAALDDSLTTIFEVHEPQDTLDRLFAHHLVGATQPFDLRSSLKPFHMARAG